MPFKKICGIYIIIAWKDRFHYIGAAKDVLTRWAVHKNELRKEVHRYQKHLEEAFKTDTLQFSMLEILDHKTTKVELLKHEQSWADQFTERINLFKTVTGKGRIGRKPNKETRAKMSSARKGKHHSLETRLKISASNKGKTRSKEVRLQMSKDRKGVKRGPFSYEHRKKISLALKGKKKSQEAVQNFRSSRWNGRPWKFKKS
jgi:group I intron endonuclease